MLRTHLTHVTAVSPSHYNFGSCIDIWPLYLPRLAEYSRPLARGTAGWLNLKVGSLDEKSEGKPKTRFSLTSNPLLFHLLKLSFFSPFVLYSIKYIDVKRFLSQATVIKACACVVNQITWNWLSRESTMQGSIQPLSASQTPVVVLIFITAPLWS